MRTIKVSNKIAIIDDGDFEVVNSHKWWLTKGGYAYTQVWMNKKKNTILMHRLIMQPKNGKEIDHINHDILDNRRDNLRLCTRTQNNINRKSKNKTRGIRWTRNAWQAEIKNSGVYKYLGRYKNKEDALLAYDIAAKLVHGEFAILNNVTGREMITVQTNKVRDADLGGI